MTYKGVTTQNIQDHEKLCLSHARVTNFSIKKWTQRTGKNRVVEKYLICSYEGETLHLDPSRHIQEHPTTSMKIKPVPTTQSDYKARIRISWTL